MSVAAILLLLFVAVTAKALVRWTLRGWKRLFSGRANRKLKNNKIPPKGPKTPSVAGANSYPLKPVRLEIHVEEVEEEPNSNNDSTRDGDCVDK